VYVFLKPFIISEYLLGSYSYYYNNFSFNNLIGHEIINIGLDPIKNYPAEITNSIDYFGSFGTEQINVKKNINIY
jgi:hypothetical protein